MPLKTNSIWNKAVKALSRDLNRLTEASRKRALDIQEARNLRDYIKLLSEIRNDETEFESRVMREAKKLIAELQQEEHADKES